VSSRPTAEKVGKWGKGPEREKVPAEDSGGERNGPGAEPKVFWTPRPGIRDHH